MTVSRKNSGLELVKKAQLAVFKRKLVKTAREEGEKLRSRIALEKKAAVWKYLAGRVRELREAKS